MKNDLALKVAGTVFILVALMHLLRVVFKAEVIVAGFTVPVWYSLVGTIVALGLSWWMFRSVNK